MFIQFWNNRQGKLLLVHNPCKNGSCRTTSKGVIWCKSVIPIKYEFALPGAIFSQIFTKSSFRKGSFSVIWKTRTALSISAFLNRQDFMSLFFKSYCDRGCFWAKYLSNHFFNNFVVYKHVSVVYFHTNFFKMSTTWHWRKHWRHYAKGSAMYQ